MSRRGFVNAAAALALSPMLVALSWTSASSDPIHSIVRNNSDPGVYTSPCVSGEMCVYYNSSSYGYGAEFGHISNISNYANGPYLDGYQWGFVAGPNGDSGEYRYVKNQAAAAWNRSASIDARVHYNSGFTGNFDVVCHATIRNLVNTKNNNASQRWVDLPVYCGG